MARCLMDLMIKYRKAGLPLPSAMLQICGPIPARVTAETCGFLVVPVVRTALLDCDRSLIFLGLKWDRVSGGLKNLLLPRAYPDDLGIEQFGLPLVTPEQFRQTASRVVQTNIEPVLLKVHEWRNKMIAHFTTSEPGIEYPDILHISQVMIEAYMQFVFDALGRPRPKLNPTP